MHSEVSVPLPCGRSVPLDLGAEEDMDVLARRAQAALGSAGAVCARVHFSS